MEAAERTDSAGKKGLYANAYIALYGSGHCQTVSMEVHF